MLPIRRSPLRIVQPFRALAIAALLMLPTRAIRADKHAFTSIEVQGNVLRQRTKGKACKIEIDVKQASVGASKLRPVEARLILRQPCAATIKVGTRAFGTLNATDLRVRTRKTSQGEVILEFRAKIHGRMQGAVEATPGGNLVGESSATPNGKLVGDASAQANTN